MQLRCESAKRQWESAVGELFFAATITSCGFISICCSQPDKYIVLICSRIYSAQRHFAPQPAQHSSNFTQRSTCASISIGMQPKQDQEYSGPSSDPAMPLPTKAVALQKHVCFGEPCQQCSYVRNKQKWEKVLEAGGTGVSWMKSEGDGSSWRLKCWVCEAGGDAYQVTRVLLANLRRHRESAAHQLALQNCGLAEPHSADEESSPTAEEFYAVLQERLKKGALGDGIPGVGGRKKITTMQDCCSAHWFYVVCSFSVFCCFVCISFCVFSIMFCLFFSFWCVS